ncbi:beta family protein [Streptomyces atratus]|uniref:beta family protein n=1 Tax=Streptomyces atratus TaxID=1893 RepID=UPI0033F2BD36
MSGALYVPVLSASKHAADAYRALEPQIRTRVTPLWTLHPHPGMQPKHLADRLDRETKHVTAAQGYGSAWLDAPHADADEAAVLTEVLAPEWWDHRNLRPVTGPGRPGAQQALALAVARRLNSGMGVRVPLPGEWHDRMALDVRALLDHLPAGTFADLLLDLGTVLPFRPDAAKEALRALDSLIPLTRWRALVVLAGGFPEPPDDLWQGSVHEELRSDWEAWHEIHHSGRSYLPHLRYGDYGIHPASYLSQPVGVGGGRWGLLRYTTARSFHLVKIPFGKRYDMPNRAAARLLTSLSDFRGRTASVGEQWLWRRAEGDETVGNHAIWAEKGNVQHMAFVVSCLGPGC